MQSIIVAYSKIEDARKIRSLLMRNGMETAAVAVSGGQALAQTGRLEGGVVICGYRLRDMVCWELAEDLPESFRMLVITSPIHLDEMVFRDNIYFLTTPLRVQDLLDALYRINAALPVRKKRAAGPAGKNAEKLEIIGKAKGVLMERNHMTEPEAHHYLQKCAMDSGLALAETAEKILLLAVQENKM